MLILCRQTIASLQKLVEDLQRAQPQQSELERSAAEVVRAVPHLAAGAALLYRVLYTASYSGSCTPSSSPYRVCILPVCNLVTVH